MGSVKLKLASKTNINFIVAICILHIWKARSLLFLDLWSDLLYPHL